MVNTQDKQEVFKELEQKYTVSNIVASDAKSGFEKKKRQRKIKQQKTAETVETTDTLSSAPKLVFDNTEMANKYAELSVGLARGAQTFGIETKKLKDVFLNKNPLSTWDSFKVKAYETIGNDNKADKIYRNSIKNNSNYILELTENVEKIISKNKTDAAEAKVITQKLKSETFDRIIQYDEDLIKYLSDSSSGELDQSEVEIELGKINKELSKVTTVLKQYRRDIEKERQTLTFAQEDNDEEQIKKSFEAIKEYTADMDKLILIKSSILQGKLGAEEHYSEKRMDILRNAEGIEAVESAIALSWVNYKQLDSMVDSMSKTEIKYEFLEKYLIKVIKTQAEIAIMSKEFMVKGDTANYIVGMAAALAEYNTDSVNSLDAYSSKLLQTPLADTNAAQAEFDKINAFHTAQMKRDSKWARDLQQGKIKIKLAEQKAAELAKEQEEKRNPNYQLEF